MCGIVGFIGTEQAAPILLEGLSRLEYRGYDAAGLAVYDQEKGLQVVKAKGRLQVLDIGGQNVRRAVLQGPGHLHQRPVFQFRIRQGHGPFGAPGLLQQFHCRH